MSRRSTNGDESDAHGARRFLKVFRKPGVAKKTKRRTNRRERREGKREAREN